MPQRDHIAHDRAVHHRQAAAANAGESARRDELAHALRHAAAERARHEEGERREQCAPAADDVAQPLEDTGKHMSWRSILRFPSARRDTICNSFVYTAGRRPRAAAIRCSCSDSLVLSFPCS